MMQQTLPRPGALRGFSFFSLSLAAHVTAGLALAFVLANTPEVIEDPQEFIDLGYEQFDEPPSPEPQPKAVRHEVAEPVQQPTAPVTDTAPRELQDESSTVAGTQQATTAPAPVASSGVSTPTVPYYKIKPKYPKPALMAGIEGYVDLKIDVKEDGTVENIRSVGGAQADLFESEARRAVSKWKYKPFVDDSGQTIRKANHQVRVEFKLQDSETM